MSIAAGLRALILDDTAVGALVGLRMHPLDLPQASALPAITYFEVSADRPHSSPQGPLAMCRSRFQIDAWANTHLAALDLAEKIRKMLDGYSGPAPYGDNSPQPSVTIQGVFLLDSREFYESEPKQFRVSRDYMVCFEEAIA